MTLPITITENKTTRDDGEEVTYRNIDLRDLPRGSTLNVNNPGEPQVLDGQYGSRYMFRFTTEADGEVTAFINDNAKATGPGAVAFGTKLWELLSERTGDISITRLKVSSRGKLAGPDKFDLWSVKQTAASEEQVASTTPALAPVTEEGSLVLTDKESEIVNQPGLKGRPFEQVKDLFDAYEVPEERAKVIYTEYMTP